MVKDNRFVYIVYRLYVQKQYTCMYKRMTTMYTTDMKTPKTFRFTERAITILDAQENATEFLEELIISKKQTYSKAETEIIDKLNKILGSMGTPEFKAEDYQHDPGPPQKRKSIFENPENSRASPTANTRTMQDVLSDITRAENERDSILEFSQDPDEHRRVIADCKQKTNVLWAEWKELKNAEVSF